MRELSSPTDSQARDQLSTVEKWTFLAFAISYLLFFIAPVFLSAQVMQIKEYIPIGNRPWIGGDLKLQYDACYRWAVLGQPWARMFPAVTALVFVPLLLLPYLAAYRLWTLLTLAVYVCITAVLPMRANRGQVRLPVLVLIVATGLASYGLQFELERGQWNVIALSLSLAAIWLFRRGGKERIVAYMLLTLAVQLKLWPLIFVLMLVDDWDDWKTNLVRWFSLGVANFFLLFVLGLRGFSVVSGYVATKITTPYIGITAHSILTFSRFMESVAAEQGVAWGPVATRLVALVLYALALGCLVTIVLTAHRRRDNDLNRHLLLACTVGACLIAPQSHDYKLSILAAPLVLLLSHRQSIEPVNLTRSSARGFAALLFTLALAYSSTLYSWVYKPHPFENSAPALFLMLFAVTALYVWFPSQPLARPLGRHTKR